MENIVTIESLLIENAALKAELSETQQKLSWFMEQISSQRRKLYGVSSEKTIYDCKNEQLTYDMDEPPELFVVHEVGREPEFQTEEPHHARPRKRREMSTRLPADMPVEVVECVLPDEELENNGGRLHSIGKELIRRELKITPAKATIIEIWRTSYTSRESELNSEKVQIVKAPLPPQLISGSMCTPETAAHIIVQKCVMGTPLYRQEQDLKRKGVPLDRQTMANWMIRCSEGYFEPIYDELHQRLLQKTLLHSDGTNLQVLREPGKQPQSQSCVWQYRTGCDTANPIVLYDYQPDKKQERPREFLTGFKGYLTTDGSSAYHNLPEDIVLTGCFSHARKYFSDALRCMKAADQPGSLALKGKEFCDRIFSIEREAADKPFDERLKIRTEKAAPNLDEFHIWLKSVEPYVAPKSKIGKAVGYCLNQWKYLIRYLLDGRIECSNNRAERSFKTFVINRKNFLFATSVAGGRAAAVMHSITETAKESRLDPYSYIAYVLRTAAGLNIRNDNSLLEKLLPENAPDFCRVSD
jgi:transposase